VRLTVSMVALYLGAIVVANFVVAHFGQAALPFTAWVLIPFDLVTRDVLHERWSKAKGGWVVRMALLIASGSVLTAALSWDAKQVALGSFCAFGVAGVVNAGVYHALRERSRFVRMNVSNLFAAVADSLIFPIVAFGLANTSGWLCASQAGSKFFGGLFWAWLFVRVIWGRRAATAPCLECGTEGDDYVINPDCSACGGSGLDPDLTETKDGEDE